MWWWLKKSQMRSEDDSTQRRQMGEAKKGDEQVPKERRRVRAVAVRRQRQTRRLGVRGSCYAIAALLCVGSGTGMEKLSTIDEADDGEWEGGRVWLRVAASRRQDKRDSDGVRVGPDTNRTVWGSQRCQYAKRARGAY